MKDLTPGTVLRLVAAVIALTIVGSVLMLIPDWNGFAASEEAGPIDTLLDVMIVLSMFVFSVVVVAMAFAIWRYRAKPGDESDGEPIHGSTRLEILWTAIPTVIVLIAGVYSWIVLDDIEAEAADDEVMRVDVYGQQFAWRFDYVDAGKTSTELHAPVGQQLELHLEALDVIHSFWVPEWRIKRDLVPGAEIEGDEHIDNIVRVTPNVEGTYQVVCTELCGLGHAAMRALAVTESEAEFEEWLAEQNDMPEEERRTTGVAGGSGAGSLAAD